MSLAGYSDEAESAEEKLSYRNSDKNKKYLSCIE